DFAGLAVLRADSFYVSSITDDLHVRPPVRLQLRTHLVFSDRLITCNERRTLARSRRHHGDAGDSGQHQAGDRPEHSSGHELLLFVETNNAPHFTHSRSRPLREVKCAAFIRAANGSASEAISWSPRGKATSAI